MNIINRLLYRLTADRPCRLITLDQKPYLERYYMGEAWGVTYYLHRFVSSDSERHVHNHPWRRGCSFILAGAYTEEVATDICPTSGSDAGCATVMVRRRWFNRVDGSRFHRIHDAAPGTWTLFCHGERERVGPLLTGSATLRMLKGWGFLSAVGATTVFTTYPGSNGIRYSKWWLYEPVGQAAGRLPL